MLTWIDLDGSRPDLAQEVALAAREAWEGGRVPILHVAPAWTLQARGYPLDPRVQEALPGVHIVRIHVERPGELDWLRPVWCHGWHQAFAALTAAGEPAAPLAWSGTKDGPATNEELASFLAVHVARIRAADALRPAEASRDCEAALIPVDQWRRPE